MPTQQKKQSDSAPSAKARGAAPPAQARLPQGAKWMALVAPPVALASLLAGSVGLGGAWWELQRGGQGNMLMALSFLLALIIVPIMTMSAAKKRRDGHLLALAFPALVVLLGAAYHPIYVIRAQGAVGGDSVSPLQKVRILASGIADAGHNVHFMLLLGSALLLLSAFAACALAQAQSSDRRWGVRAQLMLVLGLIASVAGSWVAQRAGFGWMSAPQSQLVALVSIGLLVLTLSASEGAQSSGAGALSSKEFFVSIACLAALGCSYLARCEEIWILAFDSVSEGSPAELDGLMGLARKAAGPLALSHLMWSTPALLVLLTAVAASPAKTLWGTGAALRGHLAVAAVAAAAFAVPPLSEARRTTALDEMTPDAMLSETIGLSLVSRDAVDRRLRGEGLYVGMDAVRNHQGEILAPASLLVGGACQAKVAEFLTAEAEKVDSRVQSIPIGVHPGLTFRDVRCVVAGHAAASSKENTDEPHQITFAVGLIPKVSYRAPFDFVGKLPGQITVASAAPAEQAWSVHLGQDTLTSKGEQLSGPFEQRLSRLAESVDKQIPLRITADDAVSAEELLQVAALSRRSALVVD